MNEDVTIQLFQFLPKEFIIERYNTTVPLIKSRDVDLSNDYILDIPKGSCSLNIQSLGSAEWFKHMNDSGETIGKDRHYYKMKETQYRFRLYSDQITLKGIQSQIQVIGDTVQLPGNGCFITSVKYIPSTSSPTVTFREGKDWDWTDRQYYDEITLLNAGNKYDGKSLLIEYNLTLTGEEVIKRASQVLQHHIMNYLEETVTRRKFPDLKKYHVGYREITDTKLTPESLGTETLRGLEFDVFISWIDKRVAKNVVDDENTATIRKIHTTFKSRQDE